MNNSKEKGCSSTGLHPFVYLGKSAVCSKRSIRRSKVGWSEIKLVHQCLTWKLLKAKAETMGFSFCCWYCCSIASSFFNAPTIHCGFLVRSTEPMSARYSRCRDIDKLSNLAIGKATMNSPAPTAKAIEPKNQQMHLVITPPSILNKVQPRASR